MKLEASVSCSKELAADQSQMNPVHTLPSYILKNHFNIILLSTHRFYELSISFRISKKS
jgi:hypothetical protein